jgi:hypothetical protein
MQVLVSVKEQGTILQPEQIANVYTAIILILQMLNDLLVLDEHHTMNIKQLLLNINALSLVTGNYKNFVYFTEINPLPIRYFGSS